jgi:hypothetical protein
MAISRFDPDSLRVVIFGITVFRPDDVDNTVKHGVVVSES